MIPFNCPPYTGNEAQYVLAAMRGPKICGGSVYCRQCELWFEQNLSYGKTFMTPSCTHAIELAALLINVLEGDEIIMPSYTFVSTANPFVLRGAKIVFVDIRPDTMNIDETLIEEAITERTRAIVPVHYAGVGCEMDTIMEIAERRGLCVVEDAAQAVMAMYRGRPLGSIGHMAACSFHETKNLTSGGEGGLLIVNDKKFSSRAEIIREKGTNRNQFFRGEVDKYSWVDVGSSYLPSELQAAYLWGQLEMSNKIKECRLTSWLRYRDGLLPMSHAGYLSLPVIPDGCEQNGHMFYIKVKNLDERTGLIEHLKTCGVTATFHYVPLHTAPAGLRYGRFHGTDRYTTAESERLVRLPMYFGLDSKEIDFVIESVKRFYV